MDTNVQYFTVKYDDKHREKWDVFCSTEIGVSFWHTSDRMDHALAVGGKDAQNASFFLMQGNKIVAIVPLVVSLNNLGLRVANYAGWGTPVPVVSGQLSNSNPDTTTKPCQNNADAIIFDFKNPDGTYYDGPDSWGNAFKPSQFQIWNRSMNVNEITMISQSITGTYPIGNLFYDNGFATLTHPKYMSLFDGGTLNTLKYKNTHLITENEYQCTMTEDEFEFTTNLSARKIPFTQEEELANFVTGSNFKPYVTTVGLYDDDGNCLVVGKLGQPIKASSETDTTFVIRFDT